MDIMRSENQFNHFHFFGAAVQVEKKWFNLVNFVPLLEFGT